MTCSVEGCSEETERSDDIFGPKHWRLLPRWARVELVRLRNASARGNRRAVEDYMKAAAVARHLVKRAESPEVAT